MVLISLNAARSPLETRLKALMNAYVTQFLLGTLILKEENGSVCVWVAVLTLLGALEIKWMPRSVNGVNRFFFNILPKYRQQ